MPTRHLLPAAARPRVSSGAVFFDDEGKLLLVNPTYKADWNLPGGGVDEGETPHEACMREVREELGIEPSIGRLLLTAWTRSSEIGDRIYFIFDGGVLDSRTRTVISLDRQELSEHGFFSATEAPRRLPFWLAGLVSTAMQSGADGTSRYVELTLTPR